MRALLRAERARRWAEHHRVCLAELDEDRGGQLTPQWPFTGEELVIRGEPAGTEESYRLRLAEALAEDPDGPDSPEADHLFWESSAEDHLEGEG